MARRSKRGRKSGAKSQKTKRMLKVTKKAAMTAGSLSAIALAPAAAEAAVVTVTGSPVSLAMSAGHLAKSNWDVDGADGIDFQFVKWGSPGSYGLYIGSRTYPGATYLNGGGFVAPKHGGYVQRLNQSFSVGPTLSSYVWGPAGWMARTVMCTYNYYGLCPGGPSYYVGYRFAAGGCDVGDNIFGFRFEDGNNDMHYAWANINFDTDNGVVTIDKWAYESTPNTAVHIPAQTVIPLPGAHALGLLGLGAAGLMKWRQRRKDKATVDA